MICNNKCLETNKMTTNTAENLTNPTTATKTASIEMSSDLPQHFVGSGQRRSLAHLSFLLLPFLTALESSI